MEQKKRQGDRNKESYQRQAKGVPLFYRRESNKESG
jgi:hypothetical protein